MKASEASVRTSALIRDGEIGEGAAAMSASARNGRIFMADLNPKAAVGQ